ncbi:MAG TPA: DUF6404 family protein [Planctomycetota bacterium]|nr:DUF6404 family protein [Planctomycetota bacterium]
MTHREATRRFIDDMQSRGENPWDVAPPFFRLLWRLGWTVPPPHYLPSRTTACLLGGAFGVMFGVFFVTFSLLVEMPLEIAIAAPLLSGLYFGVSMAYHYRSAFVRLDLPPWDSYLLA